MSYPVGSIDGHPIANAFAWEDRPGTRPFVAEVDVADQSADALLQGPPKPVTLLCGTREAKFDAVYVLAQRPSDRPGKACVELQDRRWLWEYSWITRGYNVRRAVGVQRMEDPDNILLSAVLPEFQYQPWSLKTDQSQWTAIEVLKDVLQTLAAEEGKFSGSTFSITLDPKLEAHVTSTPIENLEMDCDGAGAIETVLRYLPGVTLRVTSSGDVYVYSMLDGRDEQLAKKLPPPLMGPPIPLTPSLARKRPSKIIVRFSFECEVRFNFTDADGQTTAGDSDLRVLDNVAPVTDFSLLLASSTITVCQDTWLPFGTLLAAWGPAPFKKGARKLTKLDIRRCMVPFMSLLAALQQSGLAQPDTNWPSRCGAINEHFRQTFRLPRRWLDKCLWWMPSRVGTIDPTTATRGVGTVLTDFSYLSSTRSLFMDALSGKDLSYATIVIGYPQSGLLKDAGSRPPGVMSVIDQDQGVFRVDFRADASRMHEQSLPSKLEIEGENTQPGRFPKSCGPCGDPKKQAERGFSFTSLIEGAAPTVLSAQHKLAVIVTMMPAPGVGRGPKPGDKDRSFYEIEVKPTDLPSFPGAAHCLGPPMTIHVGPGIETARVAWTDEHAADIDAIFGIEQATGNITENIINAGPASFPVINDPTHPVRGGVGASLPLIARAVAQRAYAVLADRTIGAHTTQLDETIEPVGWSSGVRHEVTQRGELLTTIRFPEQRRQFALLAFMDTQTQRFILHLANPRRS